MAKRQTSSAKRVNPFEKMLHTLRQTWSRQGNTLEVLLPRGWPENRGIIQWRLRGEADVTPHGQVTELNQIPGVSAMTRVHVWTPPSESLLTQVSLPTRSRAKIQQALPFALEDQLIGEPDQLHFAYRVLDSGILAVAVTSRARLQAWIGQFTDAGLRPTSLCPAQLALPLIGDSWSAAFYEDEIWVRSGPASGFVCTASARTPPSMLVTALNEAREKQTNPQSLLVIQAPQGFDQATWSTPLGLPIQVQAQDFWTSHHEPAPALNLLQGAYAPSSQMHAMVPALRPAAIMLAVWLVGGLGFNLWEWWQLKKTHESLRQEMVALFKRTFPEAQTVVDPALQMQRLIGEMQDKGGKSSGGDMLPLLTNIAPVVQASPQLKLRGMQYGESRLTLDVTVPDYQAMDTIKNTFTTRGMQVEVIGANSTPAGIEGRLRLGQTSKAGT